MKQQFKAAHRQSGISYVETLAAAIIIAVSIVPATVAIRGAMNATQLDSRATVNHYRLMSTMEELLAAPFATVFAQAAGPTTATSYSDAAGSVDRRLVFIAPYDGDNADADNDPFTGTDPDLLWLRVEIEGTVNAMQALKADQ